jgi:class 3 adenylate cyclase
VKYPAPIARTRGYASELLALLRRRRERRRPRVRIRVASGEARVLPDGSAEKERLLSLARELLSEYGAPGRA